MMRFVKKIHKVELIESRDEENKLLAKHIRQKASSGCPLNILEAGCGRRWSLDLSGIRFTLTGVDINRDVIIHRKTQQRDLHKAILGDISTIDLEECKYDVIYSSFLLEHIDGGEHVLNRFLRWLKPGGILILRIPDRDSVYGFITRVTPFWFHIFYKKYIEQIPNAGKAGFGPFPTFHDKIISRKGIWEFCQKHGLIIRAECGAGFHLERMGRFSLLIKILVKMFHIISLGRLAADYNSLSYVIEKC